MCKSHIVGEHLFDFTSGKKGLGNWISSINPEYIIIIDTWWHMVLHQFITGPDLWTPVFPQPLCWWILLRFPFVNKSGKNFFFFNLYNYYYYYCSLYIQLHSMHPIPGISGTSSSLVLAAQLTVMGGGVLLKEPCFFTRKIVHFQSDWVGIKQTAVVYGVYIKITSVHPPHKGDRYDLTDWDRSKLEWRPCESQTHLFMQIHFLKSLSDGNPSDRRVWLSLNSVTQLA